MEYTNLLQINWNEQKLQTNFRLIVEAVQGYQLGNSKLKGEVDWLKEEVQRLGRRIDGGLGRIAQEGTHEQSPAQTERRAETTNIHYVVGSGQ